MTKEQISTGKVYELIDSMRKEVMGAVNQLREDFGTMEKGRLTKMESIVAGAISDIEYLKRQQSIDENSPLQKLGYKVLEYIILAVIASILFLVLKNPKLI